MSRSKNDYKYCEMCVSAFVCLYRKKRVNSDVFVNMFHLSCKAKVYKIISCLRNACIEFNLGCYIDYSRSDESYIFIDYSELEEDDL